MKNVTLAALAVAAVALAGCTAPNHEDSARAAVERALGPVQVFSVVASSSTSTCGEADGLMFVYDGERVEFSPAGRGGPNLNDPAEIQRQAEFVGKYADCMETAHGRYPA